MSNVSAKPRLITQLSMTTALAVAFGGLFTGTAHAQQGATQVLQDEIVITATKRGDAMVQDVPLAVTAYSADQLEAMNFQDLQTLTYSMPNVQLEDIGTAKNVANFSIRGIGINSSIPSVDPTVGVFVDGMYLGINAGVLTDNFDLEAIEVLRGPQGTLYGRNVTGGAVLVRTRAPTDELEIRARAGVETGPQYNADFSISGPLAQDVLSAKLAVYHSQDEGWFENDFDGSQFGESETSIYRGALRFTPTPNFETILRLEHGTGSGDGPAAQNHGLYSRDSFDFAINYRGYGDNTWEQAVWETNWDVAFGDGRVTNIAGWRTYEGLSGGDIDATTNTAFHSRAVTEQDQWSNELRYAGTFGNVDVTLGGYYFSQNLLYIEERYLLAGLLPTATPSATSPLQYAAAAPFWINRVGGGEGQFSTTGFFGNADWHLSDQLTLSFGMRYSYEHKEAEVSRIRRGVTAVSQPIIATVPGLEYLIGRSILPADNLDPGVANPRGDGVVGGSIDNRTLTFSDRPFELSWEDSSPRVGIQWEPTDDTNVYATWSRGFRSGGVNFRVTTLGVAPGADPNNPSGAQPPTAFDAEEQDTFEVGWKQDFMEGRGRFNLAVFHNTIDGMQRETNVPGSSGVQQVIVNAGEAVITGAELEARFALTDQLLVTAQAGYTHGEYEEVTADLNGDGTITAADGNLEIPRLAPWTYGASVIYDLPIGPGVLSSMVSYNHRDASFYNDNNRGLLAEADMIDANFTYAHESGNWSFAVYGRNLTDEVTWGGDTILPSSPSFGFVGNGLATFSPLNEGRVIGAELRLTY